MDREGESAFRVSSAFLVSLSVSAKCGRRDLADRDQQPVISEAHERAAFSIAHHGKLSPSRGGREIVGTESHRRRRCDPAERPRRVLAHERLGVVDGAREHVDVALVADVA